MLEAMQAIRKTGSETFLNGNTSTLLDYWAWAHSDIMGNTERGKIAEYIVAMAVNAHRRTRTEWDSYDILSDDHIRIEVKSSAFLQTWYKKTYSEISFGIRPTQGWNQADNTYEQTRKRQADVYVFCVFNCKEQNTANPLDLDQWGFYVLSAKKLDHMLPDQKSARLSVIQEIGAINSDYSGLREAIRSEFSAE
jgi:hypothetical protein